jgi:hypothetical protein
MSPTTLGDTFEADGGGMLVDDIGNPSLNWYSGAGLGVGARQLSLIGENRYPSK